LVFVQDFPLAGKLATRPISEAASSFRDDLKDYLRRLTVPAKLIDTLNEYDFSVATVKNPKFCHFVYLIFVRPALSHQFLASIVINSGCFH
jgi:hypothetical protein